VQTFPISLRSISYPNTLRTVMKTPATILINLQIQLSESVIKLGSSKLIELANVINIRRALPGLLKCKLQRQWRCIITTRANVHGDFKSNRIKSDFLRHSPKNPRWIRIKPLYIMQEGKTLTSIPNGFHGRQQSRKLLTDVYMCTLRIKTLNMYSSICKWHLLFSICG